MKKGKIQFFILLITILSINILDGLLSNTFSINNVFAGIIGFFSLYAYILLLDKPITALLSLLLAQIIAFIRDIIIGGSGNAINNLGSQWLIIVISIIIHIIIVNKQIKCESLKEKINSIINYERKPIKVYAWIRVIIYSMMVTTVMGFSRSEGIANAVSTPEMRIVGSVIVLLPTFIILAFITTSMIAYDIFVIEIIMEITVCIMLFIIGELTVPEILKLITEISILVIVFRKLHEYKILDRK